MQNRSHSLPRKLFLNYFSWTSRKTKMSNCIIFFRIVETAMVALPLLADLSLC